MSTPLAELIDLLTTGGLDAEEREQLLRDLAAAPTELDWASSESQALAVALTAGMPRTQCASGDKIDEVHDELRGYLLGEEFPAFPPALRDSASYFAWIDPLLADWCDDGGYDLICIDDTVSEQLHLFVVYRRDVARILALAGSLGLQARRPQDA